MSRSVESANSDNEELTERLRSVLDRIAGEAENSMPDVTFDISVAANRVVLKCIKIILEYDVKLRVVYSEANVYHPTREEYERDPERWVADESAGLEKGVSRIVHSEDHPGHALDPLPDCVMLFPGFNRERGRAVIGAIDPSLLTNPGDKVIWLLGRPHLAENGWRVGAMKHINGVSDDVPQHVVGTFDYKETLLVLERLYEDRGRTHNITLVPLGSKLQTLGAALFCHMHPDVRMMLSTPKEYNAMQYSDGCRDTWCIDFGSVPDLRRGLEAVGTLRIEENEEIA